MCLLFSAIVREINISENLNLNPAEEKLKKVKVGDPADTDTLIGPMITRSQFDKALEYIEKAPSEGCQVLVGGNKLGYVRSILRRVMAGTNCFKRCSA